MAFVNADVPEIGARRGDVLMADDKLVTLHRRDADPVVLDGAPDIDTDPRLFRLVPVEATETLPAGDYVVARDDDALPSSRIRTREPIPVAHLIAHLKGLIDEADPTIRDGDGIELTEAGRREVEKHRRERATT